MVSGFLWIPPSTWKLLASFSGGLLYMLVKSIRRPQIFWREFMVFRLCEKEGDCRSIRRAGEQRGLQADLQHLLPPNWGRWTGRVCSRQRTGLEVLWLVPSHHDQDLSSIQPARVQQHVGKDGAGGHHHLPLPTVRPLPCRWHQARVACYQTFPRICVAWECSRTPLCSICRQREMDFGGHLSVHQTSCHSQAQCQRAPNQVCKDTEHWRS